MSHKINPTSFRLGIIKDWQSQWFSDIKGYGGILKEDNMIRKFLEAKIERQAVEDIIIQRFGKDIKVIIRSPRPGLIVGRGGSGIENLKKGLDAILNTGKSLKEKKIIKIEVEEVRHPEAKAAIIAQNIAIDIEKRMPYKRTMKQAIEKAMQNKEVKGIKIQASGRLGGSEIARREWLLQGKIPLHTLRANIDYAQKNSYTTYGVVGIKVWIYTGEVFENK